MNVRRLDGPKPPEDDSPTPVKTHETPTKTNMARMEYDRLDTDHKPDDDDDTPRASREVRRRDEETLAAEEEAERLLSGNEKVSPQGKGNGKLKRQRRRSGRHPEKRELMYQMEEGGPRSSSAESSGHSSEVDMARLGETQATRKSKRRRCCGFAAIHLLIVLAFLALLYGAWRVSDHGKSKQGHEEQPETSPDKGDADGKAAVSAYKPQTLSNGTHTFAPTTILISLDGFRADFLYRNLTPTLAEFMRQGVSPRYMMPSFPSLTFPNHFTLVTGLHPESHGIVGNTFYDPALAEEFDYGVPSRSMQPKWWTAEPIWVIAEKLSLIHI